jgi:ribosomal peptide maturation radical SAM protein 1
MKATLDRLRHLFTGGDALLVLPPFAGMERPSLGLHVLKAVAEQAGLRVDIFNANVHFSSIFGENNYTGVCYAPTGVLSGEKVFAPVAFQDVRPQIAAETLKLAKEWVDTTAEFIASLNYPVIGCNTMFEQLACSVALLSAVKRYDSSKVTIIGGAQCEGEMAEGILSLDKEIDFVFSGESEASFVTFLKHLDEHRANGPRIVSGKPLTEMEALPPLDYSSYFEQFNLICPDSDISKGLHWLPHEGSRGCWWGQKHHCTFCGINGMGMSYRMKSATKLMGEIESQFAANGCRNILMVDNIMPHEYFGTLLPALAEKDLGLRIFYEQKANLTASRMHKISKAGVNIIQPGIESLSDDLLRLMKKGVKSWQNIAALRFARIHDVYVNWNLLHSFPGDRKAHYEAMERLVPLLHHLCPPSGLNQLSIDRFSPYFDHRENYGISNVRPMASYYDIFPATSEVAKLAYHFHGDYLSEALNDESTLQNLELLVGDWVKSWEDSPAPPVLSLAQLNDDHYLLTDTRKIARQKFTFVGRDIARAALFGAHGVRSKSDEWCVENNVSVLIGDVATPLATASHELYQALATDDRSEAQEQLVSPPEYSVTRIPTDNLLQQGSKLSGGHSIATA